MRVWRVPSTQPPRLIGFRVVRVDAVAGRLGHRWWRANRPCGGCRKAFSPPSRPWRATPYTADKPLEDSGRGPVAKKRDGFLHLAFSCYSAIHAPHAPSGLTYSSAFGRQCHGRKPVSGTVAANLSGRPSRHSLPPAQAHPAYRTTPWAERPATERRVLLREQRPCGWMPYG